MQVGDLVKCKDGLGCGIIIRVDDSHRQKVLEVLFDHGVIRPIWVHHAESLGETTHA